MCKKIIFINLLLICLITNLFAQDSSHLRISLLTCTPGNELYSTFGHSGCRVVDSSSVTDIVYNFGNFDFEDKNFYLKFIQGKLLYYVSADDFAEFKNNYQTTNRGITEQVLKLSAAEKISIQQFLNNNLKEQNRYYKYDFFFDNCTTRLRDLLKQQHDSTFAQTPVMPNGTRFRQAIHQYLNQNNQPWSKLGIDILLGLPCDAVMTNNQMQFLPNNLMMALDSNKNRMLQSYNDLYPFRAEIEKNTFTPLVIFCLFSLIIIALGFVKNKFFQTMLQGFDGLLFFCVGSIGIILVLMWLFSDHSMVKNNLNVLWAWPTHFFVAFYIHSKKHWVKIYLKIVCIAMILLMLSWFFIPQQLNVALIPIVLLLTYRIFLKVFTTNKFLM
jgi:Domain of unknown function (DUF4105)